MTPPDPTSTESTPAGAGGATSSGSADVESTPAGAGGATSSGSADVETTSPGAAGATSSGSAGVETTPAGAGEGVSATGEGADRRALGLAMMAKVYGWEVQEGPGDFFGMTVEHLFGEVWAREGLSFRDRRLLLIGLLVGQGLDDVLGLQLEAALGNGEIDEEELREIVIFLTHYAGWPRGAKLNSAVETLIARRAAAE